MFTLEDSRKKILELERAIHARIIGQRRLVRGCIIALLSRGHVLLEGVPGLAKTLTVSTLAQTLELAFSRVSFTPDLMPADIVGSEVFRPATGSFHMKKWPIFTNVFLADEINRAPAKVQSALLEAMQERKVTIGDTTHALPDPFIVLATENPIEHEGTYALPEAELDRFFMKILVSYPTHEEEIEIMKIHANEVMKPIQPFLSAKDLNELHGALNDDIFIDDKVYHYVADLILATRNPRAYWLEHLADIIAYGASPRASLSLIRASRAIAFLAGRDFVLPEDIREIFHDVVRHRVSFTYQAIGKGISVDSVLSSILDSVRVA